MPWLALAIGLPIPFTYYRLALSQGWLTVAEAGLVVRHKESGREGVEQVLHALLFLTRYTEV